MNYCLHWYTGSDRFYAEVNDNHGQFFGILYTCSACSTIYFEKHCHKCELRVEDDCMCADEGDA